MAAKIMSQLGHNDLEVLEFVVADHHYGINLSKIESIMPWNPVTPVPNTHNWIEGIFMPREMIISVIDLRTVLGFPPFPRGKREGLFIVTKFSGLSTAFHIDEVRRMHRVSWEDIQVPDTTAASGDADLTTGVAHIDGHLTSVLDFERIVSTINPAAGIQVEQLDEYEARDRSRSPILMAEDSKMLARLIQECLTRAGYTNIIANTNGQEAWDKLCEFNEKGNVLDKVHCVITDIEMPQMNGHMLTKLIKDHGVMQKIPVVIFSSMIDDVIYKKGEELGADAQLRKPEIGKLVATIDDLVDKYEKERK